MESIHLTEQEAFTAAYQTVTEGHSPCGPKCFNNPAIWTAYQAGATAAEATETATQVWSAELHRRALDAHETWLTDRLMRELAPLRKAELVRRVCAYTVYPSPAQVARWSKDELLSSLLMRAKTLADLR